MSIVRNVYNTLTRFARRNRWMVIGILTTIAVIMIPTAFWLLTTSYPRYWSWIAALTGFTSLIIALFQAIRADKETKESRNGLTQAIRDLIDEIREDRNNPPR